MRIPRRWVVIVALVGLCFIVYPFFGASQSEKQGYAQEREAVKIEQQWHNEVINNEPVTVNNVLVMRVPRFGPNWVRTIREGVSEAQLNSGIGHYPQTNKVGERGNYGLAGHRTGWGDALFNIDRLVKGDEVRITSPTRDYVYTVVCHVVVSPEEVGVLSTVPNQKCAGSGKLLTLTTCTPKYINTSRYIVFARLKESL